MQYLDSHIHLQDYKSHTAEEVLSEAAQNGVVRFVNPSSHHDDWQKVSALVEKYPQVIPAYGVHPWYVNEIADGWEARLARLLEENPCAFAGECGIDRLKNPETETQLKIFKIQAALAAEYKRPLIVHAVKAWGIFENLLSLLPPRTVFHSFTGPAEIGRSIQKHGFFLGINFSVLRKKNAAEILRGISLERVLLETDGPYQNNIKDGGETLPRNLPLLAEKIAMLAGVSLEKFKTFLERSDHEFTGE